MGPCEAELVCDQDVGVCCGDFEPGGADVATFSLFGFLGGVSLRLGLGGG